MFDWHDLRFFLAVLRRGSTLAASHDLEVNQTTVARRIERNTLQLGAQPHCGDTVGHRRRPIAELVGSWRRGAGRLPIPEAGSRSDIWLLYHESQRDTPHMRASARPSRSASRGYASACKLPFMTLDFGEPAIDQGKASRHIS